jgi:hypothetical protein
VTGMTELERALLRCAWTSKLIATRLLRWLLSEASRKTTEAPWRITGNSYRVGDIYETGVALQRRW